MKGISRYKGMNSTEAQSISHAGMGSFIYQNLTRGTSGSACMTIVAIR